MSQQESSGEEASDFPDDSTSDGLVNQMGERAEAERQGRAEKPGDPSPEDMQRLRESTDQ